MGAATEFGESADSAENHAKAEMLAVRLDSGRLENSTEQLLGIIGAGMFFDSFDLYLAGARPIHGGGVEMDGQPLSTLSPLVLSLRRSVLSQQAISAFGHTVADVVELGRLPHRGTEWQRDDTAALAVTCEAFDLSRL